MARQKNNENGGADFFSHDIDMRNDIKVRALRRKFQIKGYAMWCFILEVLTDSTNFEVEYNEINQELLAADIEVPVEEFREIIEYCVKIGLLQIENGKLFSIAHKRRFERMLEVRKRRAEAARKNGRKGGNPNFKKGQPNPYYQITESVMEDNRNITESEEKITEDNPVEDSIAEQRRVKHTKEKSPKGEKKAATTSRFVPPTIEEVRAYIQQMKFRHVDPERFIDYYTSNGWKVGRNPMKNWQATVRNWESKNKPQTTTSQNGEITLGVGEFINSKGIRTYGTSGTAVPPSAPPRPSDAHWWNTASNQWEKIL